MYDYYNPRNNEVFIFLKESFLIEHIFEDPIQEHIDATLNFLNTPLLTNADIEKLAQIYQPDVKLRTDVTMNVKVSSYEPPMGGPELMYQLQYLLDDICSFDTTPFLAYVHFQQLHPLMDGNGRTGRTLWGWLMIRQNRKNLPTFLSRFHYQTLQYMDMMHV